MFRIFKINNDEVLVDIKDLFDKSLKKLDQKLEEVKTHTDVLVIGNY